MTRSGIKEESIEIQSKDTMNCLSVKQEEDDGLLTVPPKQFGKLKFPPPCSVVFTGFTESTPFIVYSAVSTAHFDIDTCSFVYKLESGHTVQEKELFFGKGVQVWAFVAGEHVPAVVLNIFHQRGEEASYSLLQVENKTLYHFVPAQAVRYRADGSTKPVVKNEVKFCLPSENEMKPTMLSTPALKTHPENPPMPSISTNLPPEEITMDYPPVKRSLDYEAECSKRQKTQYAEDDWLVLHIPADLPDVDPEGEKMSLFMRVQMHLLIVKE